MKFHFGSLQPQKVGVVAGLLIVSSPAYAATPGSGGVLSLISHLFDGLDASAFKMAKALLGYTFGSATIASPESLYMVVAVLMLTFYGIQVAIGAANSNPISGIIRFLMMLLIAGVTLGHYQQFMTIFFGGFDHLAKLLLDTASTVPLPNASPASLFGGGLQQLFSLVMAMANGFPTFHGNAHWFEIAKSLNMVAAYVIQVIFYLIPFAAVLLAAVVYAGMVVFAMVYQALGIVFGPILIITLLIPPWESIAYGWLKFCFSAGFLKVVLAGIVGLMSMFIKYVLVYTKHTIGAVGVGSSAGDIASRMHFLAVDFLALSVITVVAGVLIITLLSAPWMANNVLGGALGHLAGFKLPSMMGSGSGGSEPSGGGSEPSGGGSDSTALEQVPGGGGATESGAGPTGGGADPGGGGATRPIAGAEADAAGWQDTRLQMSTEGRIYMRPSESQTLPDHRNVVYDDGHSGGSSGGQNLPDE